VKVPVNMEISWSDSPLSNVTARTSGSIPIHPSVYSDS